MTFNRPTPLPEVVEGAIKTNMKSRNKVKGDRFTFVPQSFTRYSVFPQYDLIYQGHTLKHISRMLFFIIAASDTQPSSS